MRQARYETIHEAYRGLMNIFLGKNAIGSEDCNSRNGKVLRMDGPVVTAIDNPLFRVMDDPVRDANPFFHLMEAMWMIAGRNDVEFLYVFNKKMAIYSDNGSTFHGAYGHRLRRRHELDQLKVVISELQDDPDSRRAYCGIWSGADDAHMLYYLGDGAKDLPCNVGMQFLRRKNRPEENRNRKVLDLYVHNRSNDLIWGLMGANAVHFSFFHELVAAYTDMEVGTTYYMTDNLHVYKDNPTWERTLKMLKDTGAEWLPGDKSSPYLLKNWIGLSLVEGNYTYDEFTLFVEAFCNLLLQAVKLPYGEATEKMVRFRNEPNPYIGGKLPPPFVRRVLVPMSLLWIAHRAGNMGLIEHDSNDRGLRIEGVLLHPYLDWIAAGLEWMARRHPALRILDRFRPDV